MKGSVMTEDQLTYFTSVVEFGSYTEAAFELNISQSTISKQIAQLENELNIKLFDRSVRKAALTPEGELLYREAADLLARMHAFSAYAEKLRLGSKRVIELLALPFVGNLNFYLPIFAFEEARAGCEIRLHELEDNDLYKRVGAGKYDIALCYYDPEQLGENVRFFPLAENDMVGAVHKSSPLAKEKFLTPQMLDKVDVMEPQIYTTLTKVYDLYFKKHQVHPNVIFRSRPQTLLDAAAAKKSIALLDRLHAGMFRTPDEIALIPFSPNLKCPVGLAVDPRKAEDPLLAELIGALSR